MQDTIRLTQLPLALREATGVRPPSYQVLHRLALIGELPVQRSASNRLSVRTADIGRIAETLGIARRKRPV